MRMSMRIHPSDERPLEEDQNHGHALAIHYVHYNFGRVQKAIGGPAMCRSLITCGH
jgi:hypothetical protein